MVVGIQAINVYAGRTRLDVRQLFQARGLDMRRFGNLLMEQKSVNLPCEDAVSNAVNAAKPLLDALLPDERETIETLVVGTESGVDYAKPISTYVHEYLGLSRRCRSFEVKHACYGGTAALQTAAAMVAASPVPGRRALVIAADAAGAADRNTYWEPSQGAGAVAMLVGHDPAVLALDAGANGFDSHQVMDTLRPRADLEAGDSDLSLMSYMESLDRCLTMYTERVAGADILGTFAYLVLHSPFAGMVRGAHRTVLRKRARLTPEQIDRDFQDRVAPALRYCSQVGNVYSAAVYLGLCSLLEHGSFAEARRIGIYSYGSGSAAEFYSGVVVPGAAEAVRKFEIARAVEERIDLRMDEYELISDLSLERMGGVENHVFDVGPYADLYRRAVAGRGLLMLDRAAGFRRHYRWS